VIDALIEALGLARTVELLALSPPGWGGNLLRGLCLDPDRARGFRHGAGDRHFGAYGKLYGGPVTRDLLAVYTTVVRAVPELVLILILYYAGTDLLNQAR
jgi:polar amino acid transport system permease protein